MDFERAEAGGEPDLVGGVQILFAKRQNAISVEGVEHRGESLPVEVARDVDPGDFRPEHVRKRRDFHACPGLRPAVRWTLQPRQI